MTYIVYIDMFVYGIGFVFKPLH